MTIKIIINDKKVTYKELQEVLDKMAEAEEYNASRIFCYSVRNKKKEKKAIKHSTFITAREKGKLIGFVRIIGDSTYEYYLSEIMVIPEKQRQGIGTRMINKALKYCKVRGFMQIFLTSAKGREKYYQRFGFKECNLTVMKIKPKKQ